MNEADWLGIVFTATNAMRAFMYVPQLRKVAASDRGAPDVALTTWVMFSINNLLGALYCIFSLGQLAVGASFLGSFAACTWLVGLTLARRHGLRVSGALKAS